MVRWAKEGMVVVGKLKIGDGCNIIGLNKFAFDEGSHTMKKIIAFVLAFVLMLSFSGCGGTENKGNETLQNPTDATTPIAEQPLDSSIQETANPADEQGKPVIVDDSLILVQSIDVLSKPYENFLWAEIWTENGWLSGDGMRISYKFSDIHNEIPQITYCDDFKIHYKEGVEFLSLSVYNSDFDRIHHSTKQEVLSDLAEGTYYLVITVKVQGKYIETEEKYEYSGYECAYKIIITDNA